jgi:hypothetical protein
VFTAYNPAANGGELIGFDSALGPLSQPAAKGKASNKVWSGIALGRNGTQVFAVATTASSSNPTTTNNAARVLKWDSIDGPIGLFELPQVNVAGLGNSGSPLEPAPVSGLVETAIGVVIKQDTARFVTYQTGLKAIPSTGWFVRDFAVGAQPGLDAGVLLEAATNTYSAGQALHGSNSLVGMTNGSGKMYSVAAASALAGSPAGPVDYGVPVVAEGGYAFVGAGDGIVRFGPSMLSTLGDQVAVFVGDSVRTSPVLGKAVGGRNALGYALTGTGTLVVFDASATGAASSSWKDGVGVASSVVTHPAFDCNRRVGAARSTTGILYVPFLDGNVVALIVDSPALMDANGAWPKYQRTSGNAGNDDTAFFPTNWPCP